MRKLHRLMFCFFLSLLFTISYGQNADDEKLQLFQDMHDAKMENYMHRMGFLDIDGFEPTGNMEEDYINYGAAKSNWIESNSLEYDEMIPDELLPYDQALISEMNIIEPPKEFRESQNTEKSTDCDDIFCNIGPNSSFYSLSAGGVTLFDGPTCGPLYITPANVLFTGDLVAFNVNAGNVYTFTTCGLAAFDTYIRIWNAGDLSLVAENDDDFTCPTSIFHSTLTWQASFTGQIWLGVSEFVCNISNQSPYNFLMSCLPDPAPANDLCDNPEIINCGETLSGSTEFATFDAAPFCGTANTTNGVWYSFTPVEDACVTLSTCNQASYDTKISVYTDGCGVLTCVAGEDDNIAECGFDFTSKLTFNVIGGTEYLILVHGFGNATGDFDLSVICDPLPVNDDVCNASPIGIGTTPFSNICATVQVSEVSPGAGSISANTCDSQDGWCSFEIDVQNSIWYTFVAPPSGLVSIYATGFDTQLALWEVGDCSDFSSFVEVAANDDGGLNQTAIFEAGIINSCVVSGNTYYIQLDGFAGAEGVGDLIIDEEPVPVIDAQPEDFYGCANFNPTFTVTLVPNGADPVFYQWQVSADNGANWSDLPGEIFSSFMLINPPPSYNFNQYRVLVWYDTHADCPTISDPALLELYLIGELACNSYVQVSLDEECSAVITPEMILEGPFDYQFYRVELTDHNGNKLPEPVVGYDDIGYHFTATIINICNENSCWGEIWVEDKMPPVFTQCDDITVVDCFDAESYYPEAIDNCDGPVVPELISETFTPYDCDSDDDGTYTKTIHRVYQATDSHGNVSEPCTVNIQLRRIVLDDIDWPLNWDLASGGAGAVQCGTEVYTDENGVQLLDPGYYQVPKINGVALYPLPNTYCNLSVSFQDMELETINCVTKTMRVWTVREWFCDAEDMRSNPQFIEIVDTEGPIFDCPADQTVSTNGYSCEMEIYIARPDAVDACDNGIKHIDLEFPGGFRSDWQGGYITLPDGMHELTFIAYDDCHNSTSCTFDISVVDDTAPVAVCDEFTVVSVTLDGEAEVHASSFDDGSYDDCQVKSMLVRRMDGDCPDCHHPKYDGFDYLGDYEGHYYYLSHYKFRGDKSLKIAKAMGGYAASIGSLEEDSWIFDAVQSNNSDTEYWIGFNDVDVEGEFVWSNGEAVTYTNWNPEMPNDLHPGQDYVKVPHWDGGRWYDTEFDQEHRFVLEVDDPCTWSSYEQFCCADIGQDVMVGFRVLDRWGNYNDCMVTVEVQDKLPPHIYCPPDLTIACGYDYVSMDVFGVVRNSEAEVQEIAIPDGYLVNASGPLYDGYAYDNCTIRVSSDPIADVNQCGIGYIERTFIATDAGGRETSCVQRIDIVNTNPFDSLDIRWPANEDMTGCEFPEDYPPEVTGVPTFVGEDECDLVASTFEDEVYPFNDPVGDACFKILRTWTVIDWCQREVNDKYMWSYTQIIKINNTRAPEFTSSCGSTSTCTYDGTCADGYIELIMTARDDCTEDENLRWEWQVDAYSDGTYNAAGNSNDASGEYPIGRHIIKWTVEDKCGNKTTCEQLFLIENCKPATPYCLRGLAVDLMPQDLDNDGVADWGMIVVWAEDFDAGSSHPCEELDVQLAFSPDPTDIYIEFDCSDIGEHFIDLYAITQTSTGPVWSYCTATIDIQDNMFVCPNDGRATVSGLITTENDEPVIGVSVDLEGSELEAVSTDETGTYAFPEMLMGGTYAVHPTRNVDPMNGVSTLDLVLMQRHILGIETLDSPYKVIAADVNHDEKLSAVDMLELRKLILGISEEYSNNESWRFVERDYTFENPVDPLVEGFPEIYFIGDLNHDFEVDFIGLKVGDVSGDASPNEYHSTEIRGNNPLELYIEDQLVEAGESVRLAIKAGEDTNVMGYQFTLHTNGLIASLEGIESGNIDVSEDNFGLHKLADGLLTTSWNQMSAKVLKEGDVLFSIDLIVHEAGLLSQMIELNSSITMAEAYDSNREVRGLDLNFRTDYGQVLESAKLLQNTPNPFSAKTMVKFYLPTQMDASLLIYDVNGRLIEQIQENYEKGYHEIEISNTQLNGNGVFYYTLQAGEFMATKKMVLLK